MSIEKELFEQMNETPSYWFNKSGDLLRSARVLWGQFESGNSIGIYNTYKMLIGMSFEAMAKAFLMAQKKPLQTTHQLTALVSSAGFEFSKDENKVLAILSAYIEWAGKYPTPKAKNGVSTLSKLWGDSEKLGEEPFELKNLTIIWRKMSDEYMKKHNA